MNFDPMKPYYEEAGITIYHGDCREILPILPPADLIFTSPPYNLGGAPWPHLGHWKPGDSAGGKSKWRIADIEAEALAGNPDVEGILLGLHDWRTEKRLIQEENQ